MSCGKPMSFETIARVEKYTKTHLIGPQPFPLNGCSEGLGVQGDARQVVAAVTPAQVLSYSHVSFGIQSWPVRKKERQQA